jgi:ABC-type ATPase with predicted acetyltransferase domain
MAIQNFRPETPVERKWRCLSCRFVKRATTAPTCPNHPYSDMELDD